MLTKDEAQEIGKEYKARFANVDAFVRSVQRWQMEGGADSAAGLRRWLERDLRRDQAAHGALSVVPREPDVPMPNGVELSDCWHCQGRGFIRRDFEPSHPDFGQALTCPACGGGVRRCGCRMCSTSPSSIDVSTGEVTVYDHSRCVDSTGHDYDHPEACPRCLESGVQHRPLPKGIDHVAVLKGELDKRRIV